jgi:hypothetical protein
MPALKKVFVETSVISLLVARRSKDIRIATRQAFTRAWWRLRNDFELFSSTGVRDEAAMGDPREAAKRLVILQTMTPLQVTSAAEAHAQDILQRGILPPKAKTDALHLATAMVHQMDLLLSWNFKHLVNPAVVRQIYLWAHEINYNVPVVCTPEDLLRASYES